jgi:two-component system nitrate/nitrite response regulator NarL
VTRVMVFSKVHLFGEALASCLQSYDEIREVNVCYVIERLMEDVVSFNPDVVLLDIQGGSALKAAQVLNDACPDKCILALALSGTSDEVIACANAGLNGYLPHQASVADLRASIHMAVKGECVCVPKITGSLLREIGHRREQASDSVLEGSLTRRETEVLRLVCRGLSNKQIARELALSVSTVKNHLHSIFGKLQISCRMEALTRVESKPNLIFQSTRLAG